MLLNRVRGRGQNEEEESEALLQSNNNNNEDSRKYKAKLEDSPLGPKQKTRREPVLEVIPEPGESLMKLSLRFNVPVAEVKRLNNLISEAEFHALSKVKIPIKAQSLLTETILVDLDDDDDDREENEWKVEHMSSPKTSASGLSSPVQNESSESEESVSREARKAKRFLKGVDQKLAYIKEKSSNSSNNEVLLINNSDCDEDLLLRNIKSSSSSRAARVTLYFCLLFIAVATLLILAAAKYEFYVIDHEKYLHHLLHTKAPSKNVTGES